MVEKHQVEILVSGLASCKTDFLTSETDAIQGLLHSAANHRAAAVAAISLYWKVNEVSATELMKILNRDPDNQVRLAALSALGRFYDKSRDLKLRDALQQIVENEMSSRRCDRKPDPAFNGRICPTLRRLK